MNMTTIFMAMTTMKSATIEKSGQADTKPTPAKSARATSCRMVPKG